MIAKQFLITGIIWAFIGGLFSVLFRLQLGYPESTFPWLEDIFGLKGVSEADNSKLQGVMQLLIDIRKEAKSRKDFVTSDKIRNQLAAMGILLKDEKGGEMSWEVSS